jgi:hypothetical protein
MSDQKQTTEQPPPEVEREERRLERLRLVSELWSTREELTDEEPPPAAA